MFNVWRHFSTHTDFITLEQFVNKIKNGYCDSHIKKLRDEFEINGKSDLHKKLKEQLPGITFSGKFSVDRRKLEGLEEYYPFMILDVDSIENEEKLQVIFKRAKKNRYVCSVFRSATGNGLKIITKTNNTDFKKHTKLYKVLVKYFESDLGVEFDKSTCDVSRLCYYSYDPDIYYNKDSEIFDFSSEVKEERVGNDNDVFSLKMEEMICFTKNKQPYKFGNRNNYLKLLSVNCSNHGIEESEFLEFSLQNYIEDDFNEFEITRIVRETYKKYKSGFGSWENRLNKILREKSETQNKKNESKQSSNDIVFEDEIFQQYYDNLSKTFPKKYTDFIRSLKSEREKDIVILTMMTVLNSIYQTE